MSQDTAWCPKHQIVKSVLSVRRHYPKKSGSQKTWVFISFHRLQIRHSKILLILARPLLIGYFTFYYFSFFLILTGWMRGALCVATHLYILYQAADESISGWEFFLLIPKSPQLLYQKLQWWLVQLSPSCSIVFFSNSLARSRYLSFFSHSYSFILWSARTAKSTILQIQGLVLWPRLGDSFVCQSPIRVYVCHSLGQMLGYAYTICSYGQI